MPCAPIAENVNHPYGIYSPCSQSTNNDSFKSYYADNGKRPGALFAYRLGLRINDLDADDIPKTIKDLECGDTKKIICKPSKAELIGEIMRRRRLELQQRAKKLDYEEIKKGLDANETLWAVIS